MLRTILPTLIFTCSITLLSAQSAGSIDLSFGQAGYIVPPAWGLLQPQADNSFRISSYISIDTPTVFWAFEPNGKIDSSYGVAGRLILGLPDSTRLYQILEDGRILFGRTETVDLPGNKSDLLIGMLKPDFSPDSTFGVNGYVRINVGFVDFSIHVNVQTNGGFIVLGGTGKESDQNYESTMFLCRLTPEGELDPTFGIVKPTVQPASYKWQDAKGLIIQPDGKILIGAWIYEDIPISPYLISRFYLARFNANGTPDASFGSGGYVYTDVSTVTSILFEFELLPNGKIVAMGTSDFSQTAVVRYLPNGQLDNTFSGDGIYTTTFILPHCMIIQPDGKILVGGWEYDPYGEEIHIIRLKENGTLDNTFSGDGKVIFNFTSMAVDYIADMALQANGKILVVGQKDNPVGEYFVLRLNSGLVVAAEEPFAASIEAVKIYPSLIQEQTTLNIEFSHERNIDPAAVLVDASGRTSMVTITDGGDGLNLSVRIPENLASGAYHLMFADDDQRIMRADFVKTGF